MSSKQDYEATAGIMRAADLAPSQREKLVQEFGDVYSRQNERFDRERFAAACQPRETTREAYIHVRMENAAFEDQEGEELGRILCKLGEDCKAVPMTMGTTGRLTMKPRDTNGNAVGYLEVTL